MMAIFSIKNYIEFLIHDLTLLSFYLLDMIVSSVLVLYDEC